MSSIRGWYVRNQDRITWFIIGMLTTTALHSLLSGHYILSAISALVAFINYKLDHIKVK